MESEEKTEAETLGITEEQLKEYREAFSIFDTDGNDTISKDELMTVVKTLGYNPTIEEITKMIAEVDANGNGEVEFEEFVQLMQRKLKNCYTEEIIREAFDVMDKNGDGYITLPRLKQLIEEMGLEISDADVQDMMAEADVEGEGKIKYEALIALLSEENESLYDAYKRNEQIRQKRAEAEKNKVQEEASTSRQDHELQQTSEQYHRTSTQTNPHSDGVFNPETVLSDHQVPDIKDISGQYGRSKYDKFSRQPSKEVKVVKVPGQKVPISRTRMTFLQRKNKSLGLNGITGSANQDLTTQTQGQGKFRATEPWLGSIHDNDTEFDRTFKANTNGYKNVTSRIMDEKYYTKPPIIRPPKQTREVLHQKTVIVDISNELERVGIESEKKNNKHTKQQNGKTSQKQKKTSDKTSQTKQLKQKLLVKGSVISSTQSQVQNDKQTTVVTTDRTNQQGYAEMRNTKTKERLYYAIWRTAFMEAVKKVTDKEDKELHEKQSTFNRSRASESKHTVRASMLTPTLKTPLPRSNITEQHAGSYAEHYRKVHNLSAPEELMQPTPTPRKPYIPEQKPVKITKDKINAIAGLYGNRF